MEFKIHIGHIGMTIAIIMMMSSVAVMVGDATAAEAIRVVLSSAGTFAILGVIVNAFET